MRVEVRNPYSGRPVFALRVTEDDRILVKRGAAYGRGKWTEISLEKALEKLRNFSRKGHKLYIVSIEYSRHADDYGYWEQEAPLEEVLFQMGVEA